MGTRMTRYRGQQLNPASIKPLEGGWVEVVLHTGETLAGRLLKVESSALVVEDPNCMWYNKHYHQHAVAYRDIIEVMISVSEAY